MIAKKYSYFSVLNQTNNLKTTDMTQKMKRIALTRLSLGAHYTFHNMFRNLLELLKGVFAPLDAAIEGYTAALQTESRIVVRPTAQVATHRLKEADYRRDRLVGTIFMSVRAHLANPVDRRREAARRLQTALSPFRGLTRRGLYASATGYAHLVELLRSADWAADVATLGLEPEIDALDEANHAFSEAFQIKTNEMKTLVVLSDLRTTDVRLHTDAVYRDIARLLDSLAVVSPTDELTSVITEHNGLADNMRQVIANQGKQRTPAQERPTVDDGKI